MLFERVNVSPVGCAMAFWASWLMRDWNSNSRHEWLLLGLISWLGTELILVFLFHRVPFTRWRWQRVVDGPDCQVGTDPQGHG